MSDRVWVINWFGSHAKVSEGPSGLPVATCQRIVRLQLSKNSCLLRDTDSLRRNYIFPMRMFRVCRRFCGLRHLTITASHTDQITARCFWSEIFVDIHLTYQIRIGDLRSPMIPVGSRDSTHLAGQLSNHNRIRPARSLSAARLRDYSKITKTLSITVRVYVLKQVGRTVGDDRDLPP